jgi:hypothetical protein
MKFVNSVSQNISAFLINPMCGGRTNESDRRGFLNENENQNENKNLCPVILPGLSLLYVCTD